LFAFCFILVNLIPPAAQARLGYGISPAIMGDQQLGPVTLQISGLLPDETVVVEKYQDSNRNGIIDSSDWLIQVFALTDGVAKAIGGVTNLNRPFDSEPASGSIRAFLSLQNGGIAQRITGQYGYRIYSPSARFTPLTNFFNLTNSNFGQSITGKVLSGGVPVPYPDVLLLPAVPDSNPEQGVIGDSTGNFTISTHPGSFKLIAFSRNYVVDFNSAPLVSLTTGANIIATNSILIPANRTISGTISDLDDATKTIPGVLLFAQSADGLVAIGNSDTSGNFNIPVTAGDWKISIDAGSLSILGYLESDKAKVNTTEGDAASIPIRVSKVSALFYGTVRNEQNLPISGVKLFGEQQGGPFQSDAISGPDGAYVLGASPGTWILSVDNQQDNPNLDGYVFSQASQPSRTITGGQSLQQNFSAKPAISHITGFVRASGNIPISEVAVFANTAESGLNYSVSANTDSNGFYSLNVFQGTWSVGVNCDGSQGLTSKGFPCIQNQPITITGNSSVNFNVPNVATHVRGRVIDDSNQPVPSINIFAFQQNGGSFFQAITDANGNFDLSGSAGDFIVQLNSDPNFGTPSRALVGPSLNLRINSGTDINNFAVVAKKTTGRINVLVKNQNSQGIAGIGVFDSASSNNIQYSQGVAATDSSGATSFPVFDGNWNVNLDNNALANAGYAGANGQSVLISGDTKTITFVLPALIDPLRINAFELPLAGAGAFYETDLDASGGQPPYSWSLAPGSTALPAGLNLASNGRLSGTASTAGTFGFSVRVMDFKGIVTDKLISLTIVEGVLDTDHDGIPDDWEIQYGLNPSDPGDAQLNSDSDPFTNFQEFQAGTNPRDGASFSEWDDRFVGIGVHGTVYSMATNGPDLYVGGKFETVGNGLISASNIVKWTGRRWIALAGGVDGTVNALASLNSNLYVGGQFTTASGGVAPGVAQWDGSGWRSLGSGVNGAVYALAAYGSNLFVGGSFSTAGGAPAAGIALWTGSSWMSLGAGVNGTVTSLALVGTNLFVGGAFSTAGGTPVNGIARWDGSNWSPLGSGADGPILALCSSGGNLYAGGAFTFIGGVNALNVAKWNGSDWTALGTGVGDASASVSSLAINDDKLYAGGTFVRAGGISATNFALWNGSTWLTLNGGVGDLESSISAIAIYQRELYAAGFFRREDGLDPNSILRWGGTRWDSLGEGLSGNFAHGQVNAIAAIDTDVYVGGEIFSMQLAGGLKVNAVAKWDGYRWQDLAGGLDNAAFTLAAVGTNLFVGGGFTYAGASQVNNIARWDGSNWSPLGQGVAGFVYSMSTAGSDLYVGGKFTTAGGNVANHIAKWNGTNWSNVGSGLGGGDAFYFVRSIAVVGSDIYAGGDFSTAGGLPVNLIARWNGFAWSGLGSGLRGGTFPIVNSIVGSANALYVGGTFANAGSVSANNIAVWNGAEWSSLGAGVDGSVQTIIVKGTNVFVGGGFAHAGGVSVNGIARWNGSQWSALGSGVGPIVTPNYDGVYAMAQVRNDLYLGGRFTTAGGIPSEGFARWTSPALAAPSMITLNSPLRLANGQFQFQVTAAAGQNYSIEYSPNLTNWTPFLATNSPASSFRVLDSTAPATPRFYRVKSP
jgi:hypothetical protein